NIINANTIEIAGSTSGRSNGTLVFNTSTGTLSVHDATGSGRATMNMAYGGTATAATPNANVDLTGHNCTLFLSTLNIAGRTGNGGTSTGTLKFDTGTLDVTGIIIGAHAATPTAAVTGDL